MAFEPLAVYGIIGNPVAHSLSPWMHNAAFEALKVNAVYKLFPLADADELKLFVEDLKEEGNPIFGFNVTVPYKEAIIPYIDILDPLAEKMQAVNTVVIGHDRKLQGYNTDGPGFLSHLMELSIVPHQKRIAIIGAGGTTRAILSVLCLLRDRPAQIKIYNRTKQNVVEMVNDISSRIDTSIVEVVNEVDDLNIEIADILINTTPVGMKATDKMLIPPELFHSNLFVYDVVYTPALTPLLSVAKQKGASTANGLGMLFYQGVLAFQHWAQCELDEKTKKIMRRALQQHVKE
jgi:shikimate dehydrogenase